MVLIEPKLEPSKLRRLLLGRRYKMQDSQCEIERKVDSYQSYHVCDVWVQSQYILHGILPRTKARADQNFQNSAFLLQNLHKTGMDLMSFAIDCLLLI